MKVVRLPSLYWNGKVIDEDSEKSQLFAKQYALIFSERLNENFDDEFKNRFFIIFI